MFMSKLYDDAKDAINIANHSISLARATCAAPVQRR
jgi:uncharacterized DUF497 family protein